MAAYFTLALGIALVPFLPQFGIPTIAGSIANIAQGQDNMVSFGFGSGYVPTRERQQRRSDWGPDWRPVSGQTQQQQQHQQQQPTAPSHAPLEAAVLSEARALFSPAGAASIMGNIAVETGGTFDHQQRQHGGGPGRGLFQFERTHQQAYAGFLDRNGLHDSASAQLRYVKAELETGQTIGPGNAKYIRDAFNSGDIDSATRAFCDKFERPGVPHMQRRIEAARKYDETTTKQ